MSYDDDAVHIAGLLGLEPGKGEGAQLGPGRAACWRPVQALARLDDTGLKYCFCVFTLTE